MSALIDITGQVFGRLTVIGFAGTANRRALWLCRCECGNEHNAQGKLLRDGKVKSCGCLRVEWPRVYRPTHGDARRGQRTRLHRIWTGMLTRCHNPNCQAFPRYGGKGVDVEWPSYEAFREWALANGYRDELSIDRRDNEKNYSADNCQWSTAKQQGRNTSQNRAVIRSDGKRFNFVSDAAREHGVSTSAIASAIKRNGTSGGYGWRYDQESISTRS
jgi:hypothetical protein